MDPAPQRDVELEDHSLPTTSNVSPAMATTPANTWKKPIMIGMMPQTWPTLQPRADLTLTRPYHYTVLLSMEATQRSPPLHG